MKRPLAVCALAVGLSGCGLIVATSSRGGWCFENDMPVAYDRCNPFDEPRQFHGAWLHEFEASLFYEGRTTVPEGWAAYQELDAWLEPSEEVTARLSREFPDCFPYPAGRCAFVIEYTGRRSSKPGEYGHMGNAERVIIVDRITSIRRVTAPPSPTDDM